MRRLTGILLVGAVVAAPGYASDSGLGKSAAAYLNFSLGARAIGMGSAEAAVVPADGSAMHSNPALLALLRSHTVTSTTGSLGLDRSLYFADYVFPFQVRGTSDNSNDWFSDLQKERVMRRSSDSDEAAEEYAWRYGTEESYGSKWITPSARTDMALAVGMTYFGITNIEGRSEFGAREADFQNAERAITFSYAARPYQNLAMGVSGKYLGQTLQSASAKGFGADFGVWYGVPKIPWGRLDTALVARDLGSQLKWTIPDPVLDTEFKYTEHAATRIILGLAFTAPEDRWTVALDVAKPSEQDVKANMGLEWAVFRQFRIRGGINAYNPTAGFGLDLHPGNLNIRFDYAYQYDLNELASPHWVTLSIRFLPLAS